MGFFHERWSGAVPLSTLFWRDTVLVGSAINIAATLIALAMLAAKLPTGLAIAAHFAPLPHNLFLAFAVWRAAEREKGARKSAYQLGVMTWLIGALIV